MLAEKLRVGPPMLSELLKSFTNFEVLEKFLGLIREFLPEHEEEILSEPGGRRVYKFCYLFGKRYFPLPTYTHQANYEQLTNALPVELMAMSYSAYHDLGMRCGYLLLLSLVVYPYGGDERDLEDDDVPFDPFDPMQRIDMEAKFQQIAHVKDKKSEWRPTRSDIAWVKNLVSSLDDGGKWIAPMGFIFIKIDDRNILLRQAENTPEVRETVHRTMLIAEKAGLKVKVKVGETAEEKQGQTLMEVFSGGRVPVLDAVRQIVGEDLVRRLPHEGWLPAELHLMTDGTPHEAVGHFADWACSETGCIILDSSYDDVEWMEGMVEPVFKWTRENVDTLTKQWPEVQKIRESIDHMVEWLEEDPIGNFGELQEFLSAKAKRIGKKVSREKRRSYYDPTEHWCPLDQQTEYDEEEDNDDETGWPFTGDGDDRLTRPTRADIIGATQF